MKKLILLSLFVTMLGVMMGCGNVIKPKPISSPTPTNVSSPTPTTTNSIYPNNRPDLEPYGRADVSDELSLSKNPKFLTDILEKRPGNSDDLANGVWIRDTYVTYVKETDTYYLTGTTRVPGQLDASKYNDGIYVWTAKSLDDPEWKLISSHDSTHPGRVWSQEEVDRNNKIYYTDSNGNQVLDLNQSTIAVADWQQYLIDPNYTLAPKRSDVWAPELHYIKGKWYIAACMGGAGGAPDVAGSKYCEGSFILVSDNGPGGPYRNIPGCINKPLGDLRPRKVNGVLTTKPNRYSIDGSLFADDNGDVYFVLHNHFYSKMKPDMSDLETPTNLNIFQQTTYDGRSLDPTDLNSDIYVNYVEGAYVFKYQNKYYLLQASWSGKYSDENYYYTKGTAWSYDCVVAVADKIEGPYGKRYTSGNGNGHNNFFLDKDGKIWSSFFCNPAKGQYAAGVHPWAGRGGAIEMQWTGPEGNRIYVK